MQRSKRPLCTDKRMSTQALAEQARRRREDLLYGSESPADLARHLPTVQDLDTFISELEQPEK